MSSRPVAFACVLMVATSGALAADDEAATLLGRWRSLAISHGGIGSMLEFRKGGIVEYSPGAVVEMPYRMEGNELVLPSSTQADPEQRETITWLSEDRIGLRSADGPDPGQQLTRRGSRESSASPILGEWVGARDMGGSKLQVLYFFYPGGKSLMLVPFLTQDGTYSLSNGKIHLALPNRPATDTSFRVEGDVLTLTVSGSQETRYARY